VGKHRCHFILVSEMLLQNLLKITERSIEILQEYVTYLQIIAI